MEPRDLRTVVPIMLEIVGDGFPVPAVLGCVRIIGGESVVATFRDGEPVPYNLIYK